MMLDDLLRLESDSGDMLEARLHHGLLLRLTIEVEDEQRDRGDIVRTSFMPTKAQAATLGKMLLRFSKA
jgi:hypothetical protein